MSSLLAKTVAAQLRSTGVIVADIRAGSAGGGDFTGEVYAGPYEITPDVGAQTLETARKYMNQDVSIRAIPYAEVSNVANGITVTIG